MATVTVGSIISAARAVPAVTEEDSSFPAKDGLVNLVEELGIDDFIDRTPKERPFSPTMEHGIGLCFRLKEYPASDPYICEHGIRQHATEEAKLEQPQANLLWKESIGVVDIGGGVGGAIPVAYFNGGYAAAYYGFYLSTMLRYRRLALQLDGVDELSVLPTSAEKALSLKAGSEIELVGQGKLNTAAGMMVGAGIDIGPFNVGVAAVAPVTIDTIREYSLTITGVDGNGKVRVVLRRLQSKQKTSSLIAMAGLISPGFDGPNLTPDGVSIFLVGNTSTVKSTNLLLDYTSAGVAFSAAHLAKSTVMTAFDLDLHQPEAAKAYECLLRLSPQKAFELSKIPNSGVDVLTIREHQKDNLTSAAFNFFGEKLLLLESIDGQREGKIVRRDGSQLNYRERIYEKRSNNFLTRKRNIFWEAACLRDRDNLSANLYYHLNFEGSDFDFVAPEFERYLRFGETLGVAKESLASESGRSHRDICDFFGRSAKVDAKVDVFFTQEAVSKMEGCNRDRAASLYLSSALAISPKWSGFPVDSQSEVGAQAHRMLSDFIRYKRPANFFGIAHFRKTLRLREEYTDLTGRDIEKDAKLFKEAYEFGDEIERLHNAREPDQAEHFFSRLGKMRGFKFMATIAALRMIGGPENMLVRELSLSSRGIRLGYDSEYTLKTPRDIIYDELTAVL